MDGGNVELVRRILAAGVSPAAANKRGHTPLHLAAEGGHAEVISVLLEASAPAGAADQHGNTPLHRAAATGKVDAVRALLAAGASPGVANARGETPVALMAQCDIAEEGLGTAVAMIEAGADADAALARAKKCEGRRLEKALREAVERRQASGAAPADMDALVWASAPDPGGANRRLADWGVLVAGLAEVLEPATGFPKVISQEQLPGLPAGHHVVFGLCTPEQARARLDVLRAIHPTVTTARVRSAGGVSCPHLYFAASPYEQASVDDRAGRRLMVSSFTVEDPRHSRYQRFVATLWAKDGAAGKVSFTSDIPGWCEPAFYFERFKKLADGVEVTVGCDSAMRYGEKLGEVYEVHRLKVAGDQVRQQLVRPFAPPR